MGWPGGALQMILDALSTGLAIAIAIFFTLEVAR